MNCRLLALTETRSALPPPSPFSFSLSSFLLDCSPVHPFIPLTFFLCFFFCTFCIFLFHFSDSLSHSLVVFCSSSLFLPLFSSCALFLFLYCPRDFYFCPPSSFFHVYSTTFVVPLFSVFDSLSSFHSPPLFHLCCPLYLFELSREEGEVLRSSLLSVYSPFCL